jgi:hypothetical protein
VFLIKLPTRAYFIWKLLCMERQPLDGINMKQFEKYLNKLESTLCSGGPTGQPPIPLFFSASAAPMSHQAPRALGLPSSPSLSSSTYKDPDHPDPPASSVSGHRSSPPPPPLFSLVRRLRRQVLLLLFQNFLDAVIPTSSPELYV